MNAIQGSVIMPDRNGVLPVDPQSARDYDVVRRAITFITENRLDQPPLEAIAASVGMSPAHFQRLFTRWCGLSPKQFLQAITLDHARALLRDSASVLDATYEVGLSGPGRLHDLFVTYEAMTPGNYKAKGGGIEIRWGFHPSPFGRALVMITEHGLAGVAFADDASAESATFDDMAARWPNADYVEDTGATAPYAARIFDPNRWDPQTPLRVVFIGTDFEVRVWSTLLAIPFGKATTYSDIAWHLGKPKAARAVGGAVGRNPMSFVVPCHRVLGRSGAITGYHWGLTRKRAILGWEAGLSGSAGE
ncbi:AraC family transcriptional regulator of adaptative response/methylated-DNA-[protein]-cysteine methyltransferase [Rhodobium gokarnense]|uniref:AraC family transcriptional regulator of adaptative response/methylated-DNA-[protein]-cysteine methyltransferase n=2 Tax=Rhodobium gokarnense TaxID=364296 RepID=A0ABT3HE49_9HYPH|nr:AraC family transcriptional regulator of adaptative response/methylated-DNA-[protein]-cysteine methyltransferase [Rhodobium gokarnense]